MNLSQMEIDVILGIRSHDTFVVDSTAFHHHKPGYTRKIPVLVISLHTSFSFSSLL